MEIQTETRDGALLIRVQEARIDAAVAVQFKDAMREATADEAARIVLDLSQVNFLDSSGLGAVVAAMKQVGPDRKLELMSLTPTVDRVFQLTRMNSVFTIHADEVQAFEGIAHAS